MLSIGLRRLKLALIVLVFPLAFIPASAAFSETLQQDRPFSIGGESCIDYLNDIARDPSAQSLYDAWLAGYVTIVNESMPIGDHLTADPELSGAREWLGSYCRRRVSDTFLTAAVRYLELRVRGGLGMNLATPKAIRLAGGN